LQTLSTLVAVQEKLDFEKRENIQLDLFGNEIPVAKEYLKLDCTSLLFGVQLVRS
jgi:non-specific serine/threonine protein kinase